MYDLIHMWNLKQTDKIELIHTENVLVVARGGGVRGWTK